MQDALSCKYCCNLFKNPIILPGCNHSLCFSCVEKMFLFKVAEKSSPQAHSLKLKRILSASPNPTATTTSSPLLQQPEQDEIVINCPTCNVETKLNIGESLTVLKRNDDLRNAAESLAGGTPCLNECGRKATTGCSVCPSASFCDECFAAVHSTAYMRSHMKTPLEQLNKKRTCATHQEKVTGFCTQCSTVICHICTSFEDGHKNHNKCITLAQYQAQAETKLKSLHAELQKEKQRIDKFISEESATELEKLRVEYQNTVFALKTSAAKKMAEIQHQLEVGLATAAALNEVKEKDLKDLNRALKTLSEEIESITTMSTCDPIEFGIAVQRASQLSDYFKQHYKELKLCCNSIIRYKEATERVVLGKVFTLTVPDAPVITSAEDKIGAMNLEWSIPEHEDEGAVNGYRVEITNNKDNSSKVVNCTENKLEMVNVKGGQYHVRVSAVNRFGEGPWSKHSMVNVRDGVVLTYESDFDQNGLVYYLGTNGKTAPFSNPAEHGKIDVQKSFSGGEADASIILDRVTSYSFNGSHTDDKRRSWFQFKLKGCKIFPNYYSLKTYNGMTDVLRNWELQGSNDGKQWTVLRKHKNDASIATLPFATASWPIPIITEAYRFLRVLQTGENSSHRHYLSLGGFEVYGTLISDR